MIEQPSQRRPKVTVDPDIQAAALTQQTANSQPPSGLPALPAPQASTYKVGYKCPPLATRFKKGRSGNPKGRPKAGDNICDLLSEALDGKIPVSTGTQTKRLPRSEALLRSIVDRALRSDQRAVRSLMRILGKADGLSPTPTGKQSGVVEMSLEDLERLRSSH
jgi:hypothetical protein